MLCIVHWQKRRPSPMSAHIWCMMFVCVIYTEFVNKHEIKQSCLIVVSIIIKASETKVSRWCMTWFLFSMVSWCDNVSAWVSPDTGRGARGQLSSVLWSVLSGRVSPSPGTITMCSDQRSVERREWGQTRTGTHETASRASWSVSGWTRPTNSWTSRPPRPRGPRIRQRHAFVTDWYWNRN